MEQGPAPQFRTKQCWREIYRVMWEPREEHLDKGPEGASESRRARSEDRDGGGGRN